MHIALIRFQFFYNCYAIFSRTRYHADKTRLVRRYGYEEKIWSGGLHPRSEGRSLPLPEYRYLLTYLPFIMIKFCKVQTFCTYCIKENNKNEPS